MTIDIMAILSIGLSVIGGATVLFRIVAPLSKASWDNKVLKVLESILGAVALNKDNSKIEIKVK